MSVPVITLTCDGQKLPPTAEVLSVEVRRDVNRVPEAEIALQDGSVAQRRFDLSNTALFEPGKLVSIAVREGDQEDATLFEGLVTRHAVESRAGASSLRVELKDRAIRLTRSPKTVVFPQQANDDDVIRKLIEDAKLKVGDIAATSIQHDELIQYDASDWDFIVSRADAQGLVVDVHRGVVSLRPMVPIAAPKARLEHGLDAVELELELDATRQYQQMAARGHDSQRLSSTEPTLARPPAVKVGDVDVAAMAAALGGESCTLVHPAPLTPRELAAWADGSLARSRLALLRGRALMKGSTHLCPMDVVEIGGVGGHFNGPALVSGVTHTIDQDGWRTELRFGLSAEPFARQPEIADMLAGGLLPPVQGLHLGVVGEFEADPLGEHRVKVMLSVLDARQGPVWARVARPDAGNRRGQVFWPEPGDEVIVGFINGDPRHAIILGSLYGSKNPPPAPPGGPSGTNASRAIVSKAGVVIRFDDDKKAVRIETPGRNAIVIDDEAAAIVLSDQRGNRIELAASGITLKSTSDFTIDASSGKVIIKGGAVDVQ